MGVNEGSVTSEETFALDTPGATRRRLRPAGLPLRTMGRPENKERYLGVVALPLGGPMRARRFLPGFVLAHACASLAPGPAAAAIMGTYDSPLGKLRLVEKDGVVTGSIAGGEGPCGFAAGKKVLEGTRLDDSVTGSFKACGLGEGCPGEVDGVLMLLVTNDGRLLSGAVHLSLGQCRSPLAGDGITLRRGKPATQPKAQPKKPAPHGTKTTAGKGKVASELPSSESMARPQNARREAEARALAGQQLFETGAIEEARAKFIEATQIDSTYSEGYVGVGVTYYMRDRYDEALDFYKKGLEANPGNRDAYYNMACVYALKGEKEQSLRYLRIAALNGYVTMSTLDEDSDLKSLHGDEEFEKLKRGEL
jgi:hypothetical protein